MEVLATPSRPLHTAGEVALRAGSPGWFGCRCSTIDLAAFAPRLRYSTASWPRFYSALLTSWTMGTFVHLSLSTGPRMESNWVQQAAIEGKGRLMGSALRKALAVHGDWFERERAILVHAKAPTESPDESCFVLCHHVVALYQAAAVAAHSDLPGAMYALLRPAVEAFLRAVWVRGDTGNDQRFRLAYERGNVPGLMTLFAVAYARMSGKAPLLEVLEQRCEKLHGFTHGGREILAIYPEGSAAAADHALFAVLNDMRRLAAAAMDLIGQLGLPESERAELRAILVEVSA